ncbi:N-lysine methyltransferase SETD8-like isoform X1 [Brachionus plicatilis]|uniref:[histone H4]-lysine(20) N-methyltransferase n=1 Tax=Brachionus plicatilis TaxID=10195 RepID=A0A3M7QTL8_BRAPC|nr:N-lysine methyltransferase SETD8-like isoform X1 [Brachionus plicatilis]
MPSRVKKAKSRSRKENKEPKAKIKDAETTMESNQEHRSQDAQPAEVRPKKTSRQVRSVRMLSSVLNTSISNRSCLNTSSNRKITDFFQVRKSSRKTKSDLEKEKRYTFENLIKNCIEDGLEIRHMNEKGRGIFACKYFKKGDFVCEYAGEMISYQVAKKREELYAQDLSIGCYMYFFEYKAKIWCIDATSETQRLGRLLNHSKTEGNCRTQLFEIGSKPHLILVAARDIEPGEEMLYDYGDRNKNSINSHPWLAK